MSDKRLRALERRWRENGTVEDEIPYLRERVRTGSLTEAQIYMAAYLGHPGARGCHADGMYDVTGKMNDHLAGICPCGDCRWDEGHARWTDGLLGWAQNLPFRGIDGPHAEQEALIRMARALANAIFDKLRTDKHDFGAFRYADKHAQKFLEERTEETRERCRALWTDEDWDCPEWGHQILYYIVNPGGWRKNTHHWFDETALALGKECDICGGNGAVAYTQTDIDEDQFAIDYACRECNGTGGRREFAEVREIVEQALLPWVLSSA